MVKKEKTLKRSSAYGKYYKQKIKDPDGTHPSNKSGNRRARVYQRKRRVAGKPKKIYRRFKKIITVTRYIMIRYEQNLSKTSYLMEILTLFNELIEENLRILRKLLPIQLTY